MNIGGARPGHGDMAALGQPGKFTCCLAEDEEASPFTPLHTAFGYDADQSAVTLVGVDSPHSVMMQTDDDDPQAHERILRVVAASIAIAGANNTQIGPRPRDRRPQPHSRRCPGRCRTQPRGRLRPPREAGCDTPIRHARLGHEAKDPRRRRRPFRTARPGRHRADRRRWRRHVFRRFQRRSGRIDASGPRSRSTSPSPASYRRWHLPSSGDECVTPRSPLHPLRGRCHGVTEGGPPPATR